jgi:hypothetical protein
MIERPHAPPTPAPASPECTDSMADSNGFTRTLRGGGARELLRQRHGGRVQRGKKEAGCARRERGRRALVEQAGLLSHGLRRCRSRSVGRLGQEHRPGSSSVGKPRSRAAQQHSWGLHARGMQRGAQVSRHEGQRQRRRGCERHRRGLRAASGEVAGKRPKLLLWAGATAPSWHRRPAASESSSPTLPHRLTSSPLPPQ